MKSLKSTDYTGEIERESKTTSISKIMSSTQNVLKEHFYKSPYGLTKILMSISMFINTDAYSMQAIRRHGWLAKLLRIHKRVLQHPIG